MHAFQQSTQARCLAGVVQRTDSRLLQLPDELLGHIVSALQDDRPSHVPASGSCILHQLRAILDRMTSLTLFLDEKEQSVATQVYVRST